MSKAEHLVAPLLLRVNVIMEILSWDRVLNYAESELIVMVWIIEYHIL